LSELLNSLYDKYNIEFLSGGIKTDKLGDVYEEFVCHIFASKSSVLYFLSHDGIEKTIIEMIFAKFNINLDELEEISSTDKVPKRPSGGNSKTDVILILTLKNGSIHKLPLSVKQTSARKVAFAEYDVRTICSEVGITDENIINLMLKHQGDASAKNFTHNEKEMLTTLLSPYVESLVRWIVTMAPDKSMVGDAYPVGVIKFIVNKDAKLISYNVYNIQEYINYIRYKPNGQIKKGGFGTGLSWTYATGSKGTKIQFKG